MLTCVVVGLAVAIGVGGVSFFAGVKHAKQVQAAEQAVAGVKL